MTPSGKIGPVGDPDEPYRSPHNMFEVTDLLIPEGTDLSAAMYEIGTLNCLLI